MKKIYIDFEMNMASTRTKKDMIDADIIAIGAIKYDTDTGEIEKFKSLIQPITNLNIFTHIQELTNITQEDISNAPSYEEVMRNFKQWLGELYHIEGIYTFGNLDLMCFNNTDKKSSNKHNHPRFINNIKSLFVDIKDKYIHYGIRCINYVSLKNLLDCANVKFYGEAHDPLYDAYNLFILDKTLENSEETRNILTIKDIIRPPFTIINENLECTFEEYKINLYKNNSDEVHKAISIEVLKTIRIYIESIKHIDIYNIDILRDINRKLEVINNLKDIKVGYFFLLENLYFDMKDLFDDLMLYKVTPIEYKEEIETIMTLFNEELLYEGIDFGYVLEESC
ncbi:Exonuclease super protein [Romboutsia ilealis]|uniref:Exonuclease super protein n=1 Tax=Romboutsia ilealis TaxID=1115758 RepID=A0A1V1HZ87_9FIRM|nr:3'-5' exonuclease [Romboutsia ilealis]CED93281.1 Exonuclease super protein [Romboutsia ilealis]